MGMIFGGWTEEEEAHEEALRLEKLKQDLEKLSANQNEEDKPIGGFGD